MDIRRTESNAGAVFDDALSVRRTVFIDEQGVPEDRELDGRDGDAILSALRVFARIAIANPLERSNGSRSSRRTGPTASVDS